MTGENPPANFYTLKAWWPNSTSEPLTRYAAHLATAFDQAVQLMQSGEHTTISVLTADRLELIRLWGQPMPNGQRWP